MIPTLLKLRLKAGSKFINMTMKNKILVCICLTVLASACYAQLNTFTAGDNGSFESGDIASILSLNPLNSVNSGSPIISIETVSSSSGSPVFKGSKSLKVVCKAPAYNQQLSLRLPYTPLSQVYTSNNHVFGSSMWVYIKSSDNPGMTFNQVLGGDFKVSNFVEQGFTTGIKNCNSYGNPQQGTIRADEWFQVNPILQGVNFAIFFTSCMVPGCNDANNLTYYIDEVKVYEPTPVVTEASINYNDVSLSNPTGGIIVVSDNATYIPPAEPGSVLYNGDYTYLWTDNNSTTQNRVDLVTGLYMVQVSHNAGECHVFIDKHVNLIVVPPPPILSNTTHSICPGQEVEILAFAKS